MSNVIRLVLSCGLLYAVWCNSHWSVALSITLILVQSEIIGYILKRFK